MDSSQKKCRPCDIGMPALTAEAVHELMSRISGWRSEDGIKIKKEYGFKNFTEAMVFVNKVAGLSEEQGHHPSILILYNKVRLTLSTHAVGGLSENDFIMAEKIDSIDEDMKDKRKTR